MRGKPFQRRIAEVCEGITPADAGKTMRLRGRHNSIEDHPRGCGENSGDNHVDYNDVGSPPRMRGKPTETNAHTCRHGITPADAGKTDAVGYNHKLYEDHPRGCGENVFIAFV